MFTVTEKLFLNIFARTSGALPSLPAEFAHPAHPVAAPLLGRSGTARCVRMWRQDKSGCGGCGVYERVRRRPTEIVSESRVSRRDQRLVSYIQQSVEMRCCC